MTGHLLAASPPPSPSPRSSPRRPTHMQRLHPPRRTPTRHSIRNRIRILAAVTPRRRATLSRHRCCRHGARWSLPDQLCQFSCQLTCAMRMPCACVLAASLTLHTHTSLCTPLCVPCPSACSSDLSCCVPRLLSSLHLIHDTCCVCVPARPPLVSLASRSRGLSPLFTSVT